MPRGVALPVMKKALDKAAIATQNASVNENTRRLQAIAAQAKLAAEQEARERMLLAQHEEKLRESTEVTGDNQQAIDEDLHRSQIAFLNAEKNGVSITSPVENPEPIVSTSGEPVLLTSDDPTSSSVEEELHQSQVTFLNAEKSGDASKELTSADVNALTSSQQVNVDDELSKIRSRISNLLNEDVTA